MNETRKSACLLQVAMAAGLLFLSCGGAISQGIAPDYRLQDDGDADLRALIDRQVGGIAKLKVPSNNAGIPVPPPRPGSGFTPERYETTKAKRFLGKMLFHDPVRTARIDIRCRGGIEDSSSWT